jgi:ABC-type polysaccharide/polyol phosphate export permease
VALYLDLVRYPELFQNLFRRELRAKYRGTVLGVAWTLINPLVLVGIYTLVFSILLRATGVKHYPLFVVSGLAVWIFFQSSVQMASASLTGQASLLKQVKFPRQLLPLAVVGANLVTYLVMLAVIVPLNLAFIPATRQTFWAVLPLSLPLLAVASGLAIVVAAATVLYRDVEHLLLTILLPWFFLTPIFYELSKLPGIDTHPRIVEVLHWGNFMTPIVETIRGPLFYGHYAGASDIIYSFVVGAAALALGAWVFRRVDDQLVVQL